MNKIYKILVLFYVFMFIFSCKNEKRPEYTKINGLAFGTTYHITYIGTHNYEKEIHLLFDRINLSMSTYSTESRLSKINNNETDSLDKWIVKVLEKSKEVHKKTSGFFDPTVAPLVNVYGFASKKGLDKVSPLVIDSILSFVGMDMIEINGDKIVKKDPRVQLDFSAIAKGYAVDLVGDLLEKKGVKNFIVEIGGEVLSKGKKEDGKNWAVGIELPINKKDNQQHIYTIVNIYNEAMATSGNYRKYRIDKQTGKKVAHTINPIEGTAEPSNLLSVSVLAENCMTADAYATAFMAMGKDQAIRELKNIPEIKVLLLFSDKTGQIKYKAVNGFPL